MLQILQKVAKNFISDLGARVDSNQLLEDGIVHKS
jgi:hypothetical protein